MNTIHGLRRHAHASSPPGRLVTQRPPMYHAALVHYPATNPIFITGEYRCLNRIHQWRGVCLFCQPPWEYTDFSCCFQREVWVLTAQSHYFAAAMALAQAVQQSGAAEIAVIRLALEL